MKYISKLLVVDDDANLRKTLADILRGRGSEYDPAVVDACRRVFVDKGFRFSS